MERADRQRPYLEGTDRVLGCAIKAERRTCRAGRSPRKQEQHRLVPDPSHRELEYKRGGTVEPLDVVDRDEEWVRLRQDADGSEKCERDRSWIRRRTLDILEQKRSGERAALWHWQEAEDVLGVCFEEIARGGEGQL